jgi:hypothetical protein
MPKSLKYMQLLNRDFVANIASLDGDGVQEARFQAALPMHISIYTPTYPAISA